MSQCRPNPGPKPESESRYLLNLLGGRVLLTGNAAPFLQALVNCYDGVIVDPAGQPKHHLMVRVDDRDGAKGCQIRTQPQDAGLQLDGLPRPLLLSRALNQWAVSRLEGHYLFHAGAVAKNGTAILLPGYSRSGKTTLCAGLLGRGFDFLSDEVAAIQMESLSMLGFSRKLCARNDVLATLGLPRHPQAYPEESQMVDPAALGGKRGGEGSSPGLMISPRFLAGVGARLTPLRRGEAVIDMLKASCCQDRYKVAGLDWVIGLAYRLDNYCLEFSRLEPALDLIEQALEQTLEPRP